VATLCTENINICPEYAFNFGQHAPYYLRRKYKYLSKICI